MESLDLQKPTKPIEGKEGDENTEIVTSIEKLISERFSDNVERQINKNCKGKIGVRSDQDLKQQRANCTIMIIRLGTRSELTIVMLTFIM